MEAEAQPLHRQAFQLSRRSIQRPKVAAAQPAHRQAIPPSNRRQLCPLPAPMGTEAPLPVLIQITNSPVRFGPRLPLPASMAEGELPATLPSIPTPPRLHRPAHH